MKTEKIISAETEFSIITYLHSLAIGENVILHVNSEKTALSLMKKVLDFFKSNGYPTFSGIKTTFASWDTTDEETLIHDANENHYSTGMCHLNHLTPEELHLVYDIEDAELRGCAITRYEDCLRANLPFQGQNFHATSITGEAKAIAESFGQDFVSDLYTIFPEAEGNLFYGFYTQNAAGVQARLVIVADSRFKSAKKKSEEEYYQTFRTYSQSVFHTQSTCDFGSRKYRKNTRDSYKESIQKMKYYIAHPEEKEIAGCTEKQAKFVANILSVSKEQALTLNRYQASEIIDDYLNNPNDLKATIDFYKKLFA